MRPFSFLGGTRGVGIHLVGFLIVAFPAAAIPQESLLQRLEGELQTIVEKAKPSVVTVVGRFSAEVEAHDSAQGLLGLFSEKTRPRHMTYMSVASGLIVDTTGYVITKSSVVDGADSIGVQLYDGRVLQATFLGSDPESGLSLIRIPADNLAPANLSESPQVRVGSWVTMIGNSLGVSPSVSFGVVNGLRSDGMIQISAHLIPGNSGSPIFDTRGRVLGIIAGWVSVLDGFTSPEPIPYVTEGTIAYPISAVLAIKNEILSRRQQPHAWLGIEVRSGRAPSEALVTEVEPGSPAEAAGLNVGDRIVGCDNAELQDVRDLQSIVRAAKPGDPLRLTVLRDSKSMQMEIILGQRPTRQAMSAPKRRLPAVDYTSSVYVGDRMPSSRANRLLEERIRHLERELETLRAALNKRP